MKVDKVKIWGVWRNGSFMAKNLYPFIVKTSTIEQEVELKQLVFSHGCQLKELNENTKFTSGLQLWEVEKLRNSFDTKVTGRENEPNIGGSISWDIKVGNTPNT